VSIRVIRWNTDYSASVYRDVPAANWLAGWTDPAEGWASGLPEEALLPGKRSRTAVWHRDFFGRGSDADNQTWLRYYATEEQRAKHARDWPNDPLPPHERPTANRDWRLPQVPF
jgi:hypothetical protein